MRLVLMILLVWRVAVSAPVEEGAGARILYETRFNGQVAMEDGRIQLDCGPEGCALTTLPAGQWTEGAPEELGYADFPLKRTRQCALLADGSRLGSTASFSKLPQWTLEPETESLKILGYTCRKASTTLRSNRIEIWFTEDTPWRGGPSLGLLKPDALVLRVLRNGNHEVVATTLDSLSFPPAHWPEDPGEDLDAPAFRTRMNQAWVRTEHVFRRERVAFTPEAVDTLEMRAALARARLGQDAAVLRFASGTLLLRRMELPRMRDAQLFVELTQRSRGDAYDRTGSLFLVPDERARTFLDAFAEGVQALPAWRDRAARAYQGIVATENYQPLVELLRFITPFGVGHFNDQVVVEGQAWADSVVYKQEITSLAPLLEGPVWLGAFIGNYDAGGHEISLDLRWHPGSRVKDLGPAPPAPWILPLFNTVNILEMAGQEYGRLFEKDTLRVDVDLPAGVTDVHLRLISTGHGGWGGGDEFNPKLNTVLVDGRVAASVIPWRSDCGSYRRLNPASGNFWNGLSSSDFSRSGWCPGAAAEPFILPLPALGPGRHQVAIAIPQGAPEGDSFSAWNVSGVLMGSWQAQAAQP